MPNFKSPILTLLSVCLAHYVWGQQVFQSQHFGGPGTQYLYSNHAVTTQADLILHAGADTVWDVGSLTSSDLVLSEVVTRDEGIDVITFTTLCALSGINVFACLNIWNNTQQAWSVLDSQTLMQLPLTDIKRFQRKTGTQLLETFMGLTADLGGSQTPFALVYQSPDTILNFPVMPGNQLSSTIRWGVDLTPTGQNIQYSSRQTRESTVDAWGALITPYDTLYGVLRVRAEITRNDTLTTDSLAVPITLRQVEYMWLDTTYALPVMIANGIATDTAEIIATVAYLVDAECADPVLDITADASVYYLDANGAVQAEFAIGNSNTGSFTWNFDDGALAQSTGDISHTYTLPGLYHVLVTGCMTNCLPLNTCADQIIVIEVRDTTSGIAQADTWSSAVRVFPNPARDFVTIEIPAQTGDLEYVVSNTLGEVVRTGKIQSPVTRMNTLALPSGYYCIRFNRADGRTLAGAARFVIAGN